MFENIVYAFSLTLIAWLALREVLAFRVAASDGTEGLSYPKKRLIRRLAVAILFAGVLLGLKFKPEGLSPADNLIWYGVCLAAVLVIMILAFRELHATSIDVVRENQQFRREAERQIRKTVAELEKGSSSADPDGGVQEK